MTSTLEAHVTSKSDGSDRGDPNTLGAVGGTDGKTLWTLVSTTLLKEESK
jgi:hypothetical protein